MTTTGERDCMVGGVGDGGAAHRLVAPASLSPPKQPPPRYRSLPSQAAATRPTGEARVTRPKTVRKQQCSSQLIGNGNNDSDSSANGIYNYPAENGSPNPRLIPLGIHPKPLLLQFQRHGLLLAKYAPIIYFPFSAVQSRVHPFLSVSG